MVSFAAVIGVVTQRSSPLTAAYLSSAFLSLKLTDKEQISFFLETWSLSANVTRNMIGAAVNDYMHVIGSQQQRERNAELE